MINWKQYTKLVIIIVAAEIIIAAD